jgi:hypothetical protein
MPRQRRVEGAADSPRRWLAAPLDPARTEPAPSLLRAPMLPSPSPRIRRAAGAVEPAAAERASTPAERDRIPGERRRRARAPLRRNRARPRLSDPPPAATDALADYVLQVADLLVAHFLSAHPEDTAGFEAAQKLFAIEERFRACTHPAPDDDARRAIARLAHDAERLLGL